MANHTNTKGVGTMAEPCGVERAGARADAQVDRSDLDGPRAPRPDELDAVLDLVNNTFSPVGRTMGLEFPQLLSDANLARLRVFVDPKTGLPVAHAGYVRCELAVEGGRIPVAGLGSVCTDKAYRGMGLASELVESIMRQAVDEGLVMMLISGGSNVYRRLGAVDTGDFLRVEANREQVSSLRNAAVDWPLHSAAAIRLAVEDDIPALASIYRREPVRYIRSVSDFRELAWQKPDVKRLGSMERTWVGGLVRDSLAYIIVRIRTADDGAIRLHVAEFAGARCCVLQMIAHACAEYDPDLLTIAVPVSDLEMGALLHQAGLTLHRVGLLGHTVMSLDDSALLKCVYPIMSERFGADWTAPNHPPAGPELIRWLFSDLGIPLPVPGLNYV
jgi:predicted N-acetyltransferase YhbS